MAKRKTIKVEELVDFCNMLLAKSTAPSVYRNGVMVVVEHFLHETKNYTGFRYLLEVEVPADHIPGIRYQNSQGLPYRERFENTDSTRVQY